MPDGGKTLWKYDCKIIPYSTGINTLFWYLASHSSSRCNIGKSASPFSVREYSTLGGSSLNSSRITKPSCSISLSWSVSTFLDITLIRTAISPKRSFRSLITITMIGFHLLPSADIALPRGQLYCINSWCFFIVTKRLLLLVTAKLPVFFDIRYKNELLLVTLCNNYKIQVLRDEYRSII